MTAVGTVDPHPRARLEQQRVTAKCHQAVHLAARGFRIYRVHNFEGLLQLVLTTGLQDKRPASPQRLVVRVAWGTANMLVLRAEACDSRFARIMCALRNDGAQNVVRALERIYDAHLPLTAFVRNIIVKDFPFFGNLEQPEHELLVVLNAHFRCAEGSSGSTFPDFLVVATPDAVTPAQANVPRLRLARQSQKAPWLHTTLGMTGKFHVQDGEDVPTIESVVGTNTSSYLRPHFATEIRAATTADVKVHLMVDAIVSERRNLIDGFEFEKHHDISGRLLAERWRHLKLGCDGRLHVSDCASILASFANMCVTAMV